MKTMLRYILPLVVLVVPYMSTAQSVTQGYAVALEQISQEEDELITLLDSTRDKLIAAGGDDSELKGEILSIERELFALKARRREIASRLSTAALLEEADSNSAGVVSDDKARQFSSSSVVSGKLKGADLTSLKRVELSERTLASIVSDYIANYRKQNALYEEYMQTGQEQRAREIEDEFGRLEDKNDDLALKIDELWCDIYDNKIYAYSMVLELAGREDLLDRGDGILSQPISESANGWANEELGQYVTQKNQLLSYEKLICDELKITSASDSLRGAITLHKSSRNEYPPLRLPVRTFIVEEPILFSTTPKYSTKNPIPTMKVYERGVLYRLLLGEFGSKQSVSLFRGAYPLSYYIAPDKKWHYYAGCYSSLPEAEEARKTLLKRGFKKPEVVMITDGKMRNITRYPLPKPIGYRIEISGREELTDELSAHIATSAKDCELIRISGDCYMLGLIPTQYSAQKLLKELAAKDPQLKLRLVEVLPGK